ncbi:hypothetical protein J4465_02040 [Candidatus Pacearchaeota archaeon]|nr:hypothetical protein [Candidatus Pacearchaeota archaeon]
MAKRRLSFLFVLAGILLIFFTSFTQASILIQNPKETYNFGNIIHFESKIEQPEQFGGFFRVQLYCDNDPNKTELLYYSPIYLEANQEKKITFDYSATKHGLCHFYAKIEKGNEIIESQKTLDFKISNKIFLILNKNKEQFKPGEEIKIQGTAIKENGELVDGTLAFDFDKHYAVSVKDGKFVFPLTLAKEIESYNHELAIYASDSNGNNGEDKLIFYVIPVPTKISINPNNNSFLPSETAIIYSTLYDQADDYLNGTLTVAIYYNRKLMSVSDTGSGNFSLFKFDWNSLPGNYEIQAQGYGLEQKINIHLLEQKILIGNITNGTLRIWNKGNIEYNDKVLILFDMVNQNKTYNSSVNVDLNVGKYSDYVLEAPQGEYSLELIYPGNSESIRESLGKQLLTGSVVASINLEERKDNINFANYSAIFLILIILIILLIMGIRTKNKRQNMDKYYVSPRQNPRPKSSIQQTQSNSKPRVFEPKPTTNSLKKSPDRQQEIEKLREEAKPFIERALRK